jgi:hypothetical protein
MEESGDREKIPNSDEILNRVLRKSLPLPASPAWKERPYLPRSQNNVIIIYIYHVPFQFEDDRQHV